MKREDLEIANVVAKEIDDLKEICRYLEGTNCVYISNGASRNYSHILISADVRKRFFGICTEELKKVEEKFERL